jgi:hypothetical protein
MGSRAKRPSSFPSSHTEQRGVEVARVGRSAAIAGEPGHGGGRDVGKNDKGAMGN